MARRRRDAGWDKIEATVKLVLAGIVLLALAIGGSTGSIRSFQGLVHLVKVTAITAVAIGVLVVIGIVGFRLWRRRNSPPSPSGEPAGSQSHFTVSLSSPLEARHLGHTGVPAPAPWTVDSVRAALGEIDWFQFEKFCAALLRADGFAVERKGGAQPDGGVDLIAEKGGVRVLVQCKHWRTWTVQEKVVRELLGSMTHFGVSEGALYTLKGWTGPAGAFAATHAISLANDRDLAERASRLLPQPQLDELLDQRVHHCPRCESPMVWREGNFTPFWGCSTFPRCRGVLKQSASR